MCLKKYILSKAKQQGVGLPATVFLISIMSLIVVAMSDLTEQSNLGFGQDYHSMRAFYAAESGAQIALNRVFVGGQSCLSAFAGLDFDSVTENQGLESCKVALDCNQVVIEGINYYTFSSVATCGTGIEQAQRSIEVRAHE